MKTTLLPRPDNTYRTLEQAIANHNDRKEIMLSMPHIYQLVKENNTEAIELLREDFDDRWLITSTRIIYDPNNLSAKIVHNADSKMAKQTEINLKEVPVCRPTYLLDLLETEAGLNYIRALLNDKKATKQQIIKFFTALSDKKEKKIRFWTPSQSDRESKQVRPVVLYFDCGRFDVYGSNWGSSGFSCGVIINSAKQSKFFSNKAIIDTEEKTITIPMTKKILNDIKKVKKKKIKISWNLKVQVK